MVVKNDHTKHEKRLEKKLKEKDKELTEQKRLTHSLEKRVSGEVKQFRKQFAKKTLDLMTAGFGLVAALAWNDFIKEIMNAYIRPFFGESSAVVTQFLYAVLVTFLAVLVTYNLAKLAEKK